MNPEFEIHQIVTPAQQEAAYALLAQCGLQPQLAPYSVGIFDGNKRLVASAGLDGYVIKGIAVAPDMRRQSLISPLIKHMANHARKKGGIGNLMLFTKPEYKRVFAFHGLSTIAQAEKAVLMEARPIGLDVYCQYLREESEAYQGTKGVIVMNANPLTRGHAFLVEQASKQVDHLFIIPVREDQSEFSYAERRMMLMSLERIFPNVHVLKGSRYVISSATFPTYFIKEASEIADTHIELDCDIFARHIAPSLGVSVRFVGSEQTDPLTARYNMLMKKFLPFKVVEIDRIEHGDKPISASRVRKAMMAHKLYQAWDMIYPGSYPYVLSHAASWALGEAYPLIPKQQMRMLTTTLRPYFVKMANPNLEIARIKELGERAEKDLQRGIECPAVSRRTILTLGLALAAIANLIEQTGYIAAPEFKEEMQRLALSLNVAPTSADEKILDVLLSSAIPADQE